MSPIPSCNSSAGADSKHAGLLPLGLSLLRTIKYTPFLSARPPKEMTEQSQGSGAPGRRVPVCCGPGLGTARCRSCWSSRSAAWRAAAPSGGCSSSAGGCAPLPLCCHGHGRRRLSGPPFRGHSGRAPLLPPDASGASSHPEYLGEAEPCRSVLLDFMGVLTFSGTTRLVLTSPNMSWSVISCHRAKEAARVTPLLSGPAARRALFQETHGSKTPARLP